MPALRNRRANAPPVQRRSRDSLGQVLDFMRLLWAVDHGLTKMSKRMERTLGVTGPQRTVLRIVGRHPGTSAGDLATWLHVHPSTLTGVLRRLTDRGLLERTTDPEDGRRAIFRLTRKGAEVDAVRSGTAEGCVRVALSTISASDLKVTARVLSRIAEHLSEP